MGKTSSGKDTVYKRVLDNLALSEGALAPKTVVIYTTRPMRPGEQSGERKPDRFLLQPA